MSDVSFFALMSNVDCIYFAKICNFFLLILYTLAFSRTFWHVAQIVANDRRLH